MRYKISVGIVLVVMVVSLIMGTGFYMRGRAFSKAHALDGITVTVSGVKWSFCGDMEIETQDGDRIYFPGHTPFASYVFTHLWLDELVVPIGSQLCLHRIDTPQITPSWEQSGIVADQWSVGTWLQVEIVEHF